MMRRTLPMALLLAITGLVAAVGCTTPHQELADGELLVREVFIVSADGESPSGPTDVLIRDQRIAEIGPDLRPGVAASQRVIEGAGRYLSPGLVDGHTHLAEIPGMTFEQEQSHPELAAAARQQIPRSYLFHGFTTVIDLNSRPASIERWNQQPLRPHAYFCGAAPLVDGYPMHFMPQPVRYQLMPYFLLDPQSADALPGGTDSAEHTPTAVVERIKADGGLCVKSHFEPGFGASRDLPLPAVELIQELVAAARDQDLPVLLHANSHAAQRFGVAAGVDAFAHGTWKWDATSTEEPRKELLALLDEIIEQQVGWQPTIQVLYGERDLHDPDYLATPALRDVVPASLIEWYRTEEGQWMAAAMREVPFVAKAVETGRWAQLNEDAVTHVTAALSYLAEHQGHLIFGSDTPSAPTYANPPGLNGRLEMDRWSAAGVTPSQLLRAATVTAAEFFGLQQEIGTIDVGKRADLLLMRSNPLETVAAFDEIDLVFVAGRPLARHELSASREQARKSYYR